MSGAGDSKADKVQFNVYLPPGLVREIKHRAIDEGASLSALVERAMSEFLAGKETSRQQGTRRRTARDPQPHEESEQMNDEDS